MDRKLLDYLPPALRGVLEYQAINAANEPEIAAAWDALALVLANQFLDTATANGVSMWERELNIRPKDTDTLEERKQRLKAAWAYGAVYTYNWLVDWLQTSSKSGEYRPPTVDGYTLKVEFPAKADHLYLLASLRKYIPANMRIAPGIMLDKQHTSVYVGLAIAQAITVTYGTPAAQDFDFIYVADEEDALLANESGARLIM